MGSDPAVAWSSNMGSGTKDAWKGVGASVLLHVACAAMLFFAIPGMLPFRTPPVIDLTIGGPWETGVAAAPAPGRSRVGPALIRGRNAATLPAP